MKAIPTRERTQRYIEPFIGGGAVFYKVGPPNAYLSDLNQALIGFYTVLKDQPRLLHEKLGTHVGGHSADNYYAVRSEYNKGGDAVDQASRFLYLNLTCFNGVYRVNLKGEYNVPVGRRTRLDWPSEDSILEASAVLQHTTIECCDFECSLAKVRGGDFVFLDPPYPALSETGFFQHYTLERFPTEAQRRLAASIVEIDQLGAKFLMTNADTPLIRQLYSKYHITEQTVPRYVSCKNTKPRATELIISNYEYSY